MRVELLYFDDCPSYQALRPRVERLLADRGLVEHLELVRIASMEEAQARRFLGSPTLRIDGRDVEPGADERTDFGMNCRLYPSEEGLRPAPSDQLIAAALEGARQAG
jgi:hypothetical protein